MEKLLRNKRTYLTFILPALLVYTALVILPIGMSAYYSTLDWDGIGNGTFVGLENFINLFTKNTAFTKSIVNSLVLAVVSIVLEIIPGGIIAIILARGFPGEKVFRTIFFIPVVLSSVVIGQLFLKIYNSNYGLLNAIIERFGGTGVDWLGWAIRKPFCLRHFSLLRISISDTTCFSCIPQPKASHTMLPRLR